MYTAEENGEYIVRIEDADGKTERKAKVGAETEYGMVSLLFLQIILLIFSYYLHGRGMYAVSYTHLDVYKRQGRSNYKECPI